MSGGFILVPQCTMAPLVPYWKPAKKISLVADLIDILGLSGAHIASIVGCEDEREGLNKAKTAGVILDSFL